MRSIQFTVGRLEFVDSGKFMVAGRNCRDALRRGDRLRLVNGCTSEKIEVIVDEITMYDRIVSEVDPGMNGTYLTK